MYENKPFDNCSLIMHLIAHKTQYTPYFLNHKMHLKSFNFSKNQKYTLQCSVPNVWILLCFLN